MLYVQCALCAVCRSIHIKAKIQIIDRRKKKLKKRNNEKYFHMFNKSCFELGNGFKALLEWFFSLLIMIFIACVWPWPCTVVSYKVTRHSSNTLTYFSVNCFIHSTKLHSEIVQYSSIYYYTTIIYIWITIPSIECGRSHSHLTSKEMRMCSTVNNSKWLISSICFHGRNVSKF